MTKVRIPFLPRFKEALLSGRKTWTSRTRVMGMPGDTFEVFGAEFEILEVRKEVPLHEVMEHWKEEGCESWEDAVRTWESIHPRKGFNPDQNVVVHIFRRKENKILEEYL